MCKSLSINSPLFFCNDKEARKELVLFAVMAFILSSSYTCYLTANFGGEQKKYGPEISYRCLPWSRT